MDVNLVVVNFCEIGGPGKRSIENCGQCQLGFLLYNAECIHATLFAFVNGGFSEAVNCGTAEEATQRLILSSPPISVI
jgi:hypothetical protein